MVIMKLIAVLILISSIASIKGQRIETKEIGGMKYFVSDMWPYPLKFNFYLAYQYCRNSGMELLTMTDLNQSSQLIDFFVDSGKNQQEYWTSGNRLGSSPWAWMSTGHQYNSTFSFWNFQQELNPNLNCMSLRGDKWIASDCLQEKPFICQLTRCYYFNYVVTKDSSPKNVSNSPSHVKKSPLDVRNSPPDVRNSPPDVRNSPSDIRNSSPDVKKSPLDVRNSTNNNNRFFVQGHSISSASEKVSLNTSSINAGTRPLETKRTNLPIAKNILNIIPGIQSRNEIEPKTPTQELLPPVVLMSEKPEGGVRFRPVKQQLERKTVFSWALTDQNSK